MKNSKKSIILVFDEMNNFDQNNDLIVFLDKFISRGNTTLLR
jgi:hypothetical protein